MRGANTTTGVMARWIAGVALASILAVGIAAGGRPAVAQGGPLPADVGAAIEAAIRAGEAAAANAALSAQIARHPTPGLVVERARGEVVEATLAGAVIDGIARHPEAVSAIVRAAVARAPNLRAAIASRAAVAFPAFAGAIAVAANVAPPATRPIAFAAPAPRFVAPLAPVRPSPWPAAATPTPYLEPLTGPAPYLEPTAAGGGPLVEAATAEAYVDGIYVINTDYWLGYLQNGRRMLTSPLDFDRDDWITVAVLAGITGSLILVDDAIIDFWQGDVRSGGTDDVSNFFTIFGQEEMVFGLLGAYALAEALDFRRGKATALMALESFVLSGALVHGFKYLFGRERPDKGDAYAFGGPGASGDNASFPSGHTVVAFAVASVVSEMYGDELPLASWLAYTAAAGTAWSRVNDDDHYVSDVFAAAAIGYFVGKLVTRFNPFLARYNVALEPLERNDAQGLAVAFRF